MRLEAHHIPDSPDPDPRGEAAPADTAPAHAAPAQTAPGSPAPGAAGPPSETPLNSASPTRDHSTTRPRDHFSPPEHSTTRALEHFPSPLTPAETHALETYLFTHNRNLTAVAADLGCPAVLLHLFLRQPHIAPIVDELTTAGERRELLPIIDQLKSDIFTSDNPAERRRTATVVINFYTRGIRPTRPSPKPDPDTPTRGRSPSKSRATAPPGSAGAAVSTPSTSPRPTNTAASPSNPTTTTNGAPTAKEGFASNSRATGSLGSASAPVSTSSTSARPAEDTPTNLEARATGSVAEPVATSPPPSTSSSNPNPDPTNEHLRDSFASIAQQDQPVDAPIDPTPEPEEPAAQQPEENSAALAAPPHLTRADYGPPDIEAMPADIRRVAEETGIYKRPRPPPRQVCRRYTPRN